MKKIIFALFTIVLFASCEKEISIDLNSKDPKIVIEGIITDETTPYTVRISQTVNFSDSNNNPPITNALVIIKDNAGVVDTLKQQVSGTYITQKIVGKPGSKYDLHVKIANNEYFATSTMPEKVRFENVVFNKTSNPIGKSSYMTIPIFTDPIALGNCYRFIQSTSKMTDKTIIVANDNTMNGLPNKRPILSMGLEINTGDTVTVDMRCIDTDTYNYFFTLSQIAGSNPAGSSVPSNPPNNITGKDALGYFSAQTVSSLTKVVK